MPDWLDNIGRAVATASATELNRSLGGDQSLIDTKRGEDVTASKSADRKINSVIVGGFALAAIILLVMIVKKR